MKKTTLVLEERLENEGETDSHEENAGNLSYLKDSPRDRESGREGHQE